MAAKPKTFSTDWKSHDATGAAAKRFSDAFEKEMGAKVTDTADGYEVISTGSLNLDYATGIGGIPTGRITEIHGPEYAGKSSLCILTAANAQRQFPKKKVAWLDMEQTLDPVWASNLGLDVAAMWRPPVKTAEDVADYAKRLVESGMCSMVIIDSIGAMITRREFQKDSDEAAVAAVASVVTRMVKQLSPMAKSNGTAVVVVNQIRSLISANAKGAQTHNPGGWALRHITSMKLKVAKAYSGGEPPSVTVMGEKIPVGHEMAIKVEKNKFAPAGRVASVWLYNRETAKYGPVGIDSLAETVTLGKRLGIITGAGWLSLPGVDKTVNGEVKAVEFLRAHPEVAADIRTQVLATLVGTLAETEDDTDDDPLGIREVLV